MKNKAVIAEIALFLSVFIILVSCGKQKTEWQGTIEEVDGVTVVKNPIEPMYGSHVFALEEELLLSDKGKEDLFIFTRLCNISVDEDEDIYVCDQQEGHILKFDKNGNCLRKIGRMGNGPGEFNVPYFVKCLGDGKIAVEDRDKLSFFTSDGRFIRSIPLRKNGVTRVEFDCDGNIYASKRIIEDKSFIYELQKFDVDLNYLFSITSYPNFLRQRKKYNPFRYSLRWDLTQNNNLVFGSLDEYKIYVLDSNGKLIKRIEKQYIPVEISTEEKNSAKELIPPGYNLVLPKYHTAYRWIFVGDGDKIYVETWEKTKDGEFYLYDVFDNEGKYIAKIPSKSLQKSMLCWKHDKFYAIERDEQGYQYVKRYKVTWKI